jgi:hypothetical protein
VRSQESGVASRDTFNVFALLTPSSFLLTLALLTSTAAADGGRLRLSAPVGSVLVTVFTSPTPVRVGLVDVSVLLQRRADAVPVLDGSVRLSLRAVDDSTLHRSADATRAAATNQLLYTALLDVPAAGRWAVDVGVRAADADGTVSFELEVAEALPPALAFWPYFALPAVAVGLYALHQRLRARREAAGRAALRVTP